MKNILVLSLLSLGILSCKKSDEKLGNLAPQEDSIATETPKNDTDLADLKEISVQYFENQLQNKNNDTLYINNFFATWCGPCMQEIPHFKKKLDEMANQPVKFTFISLDNKTDWPTAVNNFADEYKIRKHVVLLDPLSLNQEFFTKNFKTWSGEFIPFTMMKKGDKIEEITGAITEEVLNQKISAILSATSK